MNYQTVFERRFLLKKLPEPLTRASEHLQILENFIEKTRLCLRKIRAPQTKENKYLLEQKFPVSEDDFSVWNLSQIYLNEAEYQAFEQLKGRESRFNRYFLIYQNKQIEIDVFLNKDMSGSILARISFETFAEMQDFETPVFAVREVKEV